MYSLCCAQGPGKDAACWPRCLSHASKLSFNSLGSRETSRAEWHVKAAYSLRCENRRFFSPFSGKRRQFVLSLETRKKAPVLLAKSLLLVRVFSRGMLRLPLSDHSYSRPAPF